MVETALAIAGTIILTAAFTVLWIRGDIQDFFRSVWEYCFPPEPIRPLADPRVELRRLRREQMKAWDDEYYRLLPPTPKGHPDSCKSFPLVEDEYTIVGDDRPNEVVTIARCPECGWMEVDRSLETPPPVNNGFLSLYRAGYSLKEIQEVEERMRWNRWERR